MRKLFFLLSVVSATALLAGCGIGPFIKQSADEPKLHKAKGKTVIVGHFIQTERYISITQSREITEILESATYKDISYQVSRYLREQGIESEAIKNPEKYKLKENEILLQGAIVPGRQHLHAEALTVLLFFPLVLPTPWSYPTIVRREYFYELSDHTGKVLFASEYKKIEGRYKNYFYWSLLSARLEDELKTEVDTRIFGEITSLIK